MAISFDKSSVQLRPAMPDDRPFARALYFETQRWIIEALFGWRGDDVEQLKFDEVYDETNTSVVEASRHAVGWLTVLRDSNNIEVQSIYIAPQEQGRGLGTYLLQRLIAEADAGQKTVTLSTAKINPARRLYERLGFLAVDESSFKVYMVRAPKHELDRIHIREETQADIPAISLVHELAFGRSNEARLIEKLREESVIAASIVAISEGRVIASAIFSRLCVHAPAPISALALAPVAVAPSSQSRGIGSRILRYGLAICRQRKHDAVLVLGEPEYYKRFGFSSDLAQKVLSPYSNCGRHWMALELRKLAISATTIVATYPQAFQEVD